MLPGTRRCGPPPARPARVARPQVLLAQRHDLRQVLVERLRVLRQGDAEPAADDQPAHRLARPRPSRPRSARSPAPAVRFTPNRSAISSSSAGYFGHADRRRGHLHGERLDEAVLGAVQRRLHAGHVVGLREIAPAPAAGGVASRPASTTSQRVNVFWCSAPRYSATCAPVMRTLARPEHARRRTWPPPAARAAGPRSDRPGWRGARGR